MVSRKYCSVPCCGEKFGSMFKFPKDPILRERWKSASKVNRSVSNYMHVCYRHFRDTDVHVSVSGKYSRIRSGAVPVLNLPESVRRKGRRNCIVHTCQKDESQGITLHFFPKNPELQQKWVSSCKVVKNVSRNTRICSSHFSDDDFVCGANGLKALKSKVFPSRNLPVSFPSMNACNKSKQWSASRTTHFEYEETIDLIDGCNPCESEDAWIQTFINEHS